MILSLHWFFQGPPVIGLIAKRGFFILRAANLNTESNLSNGLIRLQQKAKPQIDEIIKNYIVALSQQTGDDNIQKKYPTPEKIGESLRKHLYKQLKNYFLNRFLILYNQTHSKRTGNSLIIDLSRFEDFELDEKMMDNIIEEILFLPEAMGGTITDFTYGFWKRDVISSALKKTYEGIENFSHDLEVTRGPLGKRVLELWDDKRKKRKAYPLTTALNDALDELKIINKDFAAGLEEKNLYSWLKKWKEFYLTKDKKLVSNKLNKIPELKFYKNLSINDFEKI